MMPTENINNEYANSAVFHHFGLRSIYVKLGTRRYPDRDFEPNFEIGPYEAYARVYNELMRCSDKNMNFDTGMSISYQDFRDVYPLFAFDVRNQNDPAVFNTGNPIDI